MINNKFIIVVILFALSCTHERLFDKTVKLPSEGWAADNSYRFNVNVADTSVFYDVNIHLRNTAQYKYSNLWLFIETTAPNGNSLRDTVEFMLADESGRWLGMGLGNINTMKLPYLQNIRFPYRGIYEFTIIQAMRSDPLENILDVGLHIKEHKN